MRRAVLASPIAMVDHTGARLAQPDSTALSGRSLVMRAPTAQPMTRRE